MCNVKNKSHGVYSALNIPSYCGSTLYDALNLDCFNVLPVADSFDCFQNKTTRTTLKHAKQAHSL